MYFSTKSYLKNTRNHTTKHAREVLTQPPKDESCDHTILFIVAHSTCIV